MSEIDFFKPGRQSKPGIVLIFAENLVRIIRSFWVLGVYFLFRDNDPLVLFSMGMGLILVLLSILVYSFLYYLKFEFHIDREKGSFVLKKGVFSSDVVNIPFSKIQQVNFKRNILQRLIGVYSLQIDTAGSEKEEVEIKALSREKAEILAELLMEFSQEEGKPGQETLPEEERVSPHWEYRLGILRLLKLGLTSNYLRGLAVLTAFYFTLKEQMNISGIFPGSMPNPFMMEMASSVLLIIGLIFLGMVITMGETFIRYYNLYLKMTASGLLVEMGLRDNTKVRISSQRVQVMQVVTNPLQKKLDIHQLQIFVASSRDSLSRRHIKIPGLPVEIISAVKNAFFDNAEEGTYTVKPDRILMYRRIFRKILAVMIISILLGSFSGFPLYWITGLAVILVLGIIAFELRYYRVQKLCVSPEFLFKYSGLWNRRKQVMEIYKLQAVTVSQPIFYKNRGLVNLEFHTAGGDVSFNMVQREEVLNLVNYILYKVEATQKPWM